MTEEIARKISRKLALAPRDEERPVVTSIDSRNVTTASATPRQSGKDSQSLSSYLARVEQAAQVASRGVR